MNGVMMINLDAGLYSFIENLRLANQRGKPIYLPDERKSSNNN